jgi:hypothetical protein
VKGGVKMSSNLETGKSKKPRAGRYKMVFLDYLAKVDNLYQCSELMEQCERFRDMRDTYGGKLISVMEYRKDFLSLCDTLRDEYGLAGDFNEAIDRVTTDLAIRREEEAQAYSRLKVVIREWFGDTEKIIQMCGSRPGTTNLRMLLTEDEDAVARRKFFRRILMREGEAISPLVLLTMFREEVYILYNHAEGIMQS